MKIADCPYIGLSLYRMGYIQVVIATGAQNTSDASDLALISHVFRYTCTGDQRAHQDLSVLWGFSVFDRIDGECLVRTFG